MPNGRRRRRRRASAASATSAVWHKSCTRRRTITKRNTCASFVFGTEFQGGGHGSGGEGRGRRCGSRGAHTQHQLLHQTAEAAEARRRRRRSRDIGFQGGGRYLDIGFRDIEFRDISFGTYLLGHIYTLLYLLMDYVSVVSSPYWCMTIFYHKGTSNNF